MNDREIEIQSEDQAVRLLWDSKALIHKMFTDLQKTLQNLIAERMRKGCEVNRVLAAQQKAHVDQLTKIEREYDATLAALEGRKVPGVTNLIWEEEPERTIARVLIQSGLAANGTDAHVVRALAAHWPAAPREEAKSCASCVQLRKEKENLYVNLNTEIDGLHEDVSELETVIDARDAEIERLRIERDHYRARMCAEQDERIATVDKRVTEAVAASKERCALLVEDAHRAAKARGCRKSWLNNLWGLAQSMRDLTPASPAGVAPRRNCIPLCDETTPVRAGEAAGTVRCTMPKGHDGQHECRGTGGALLLAWPSGEAPVPEDWRLGPIPPVSPGVEATCERCEGAGWLWGHQVGNHITDQHYTCPDCHGSGLASKSSGEKK
jgi:regulator of replication initiation timing